MGLSSGENGGASQDGIRVALAGNPNVGKSSLFNLITGLNQHTGNWVGKTVDTAEGKARYGKLDMRIVDLPGTYSMYASSPEEEVAADYIAFSSPDVVAIVCDAVALERSLSFVLSVLELCERAVVVVNLLDEAARRGVKIDLLALEEEIGCRVVGCVARERKSRELVLAAIAEAAEGEPRVGRGPTAEGETLRLAEAIADGEPTAREIYIANRIIIGGEASVGARSWLGFDPLGVPDTARLVRDIREKLRERGEHRFDAVTLSYHERSREIVSRVVRRREERPRMPRLDRILTGRVSAYPVMLLLLLLVLYITVTLANYPSELLSRLFGELGVALRALLLRIGTPSVIVLALVDGIYTVLAEVVSVMLPPMAIFFPLFTLLEDLGYLPRVAYNLDRPFACVGACGKQSLTMCMGLGCNAAGIVGCRIIDTPRERTLAIVTNSLMPCNGRFPTVILLVGLFLGVGGRASPILVALVLLLVIVLGVLATFLVTFFLSHTFYRGEPSFFTIEMPPFRRPRVARVLARSFLDRTLTVLLRAVAVAAPAGLLIWLLSTVTVGGGSLLYHLCAFLDPLGRLMGMDGVILAAFILAFPANELVIPLVLVGYSGVGIGEALGAASVGEVLLANGWSGVTAVCVIIFSLMHWPCSTSLISVYRETRSKKAVLLALLCPSLLGFILTCLVNLLFG